MRVGTAQDSSAVVLHCDPSQSCAEIDIQTGHTRVLTFPRSFKEVVLGSPDIVDVQVKGDRVLLINAKQKVGSTSLTLFNDAGGTMLSSVLLERPEPDPPAAPGRVRVFGSRQGGPNGGYSVHNYHPYACTSAGCVRLTQEMRGEHSRDVFVPGLQPPPTTQQAQQYIISPPSAGPSGTGSLQD